MSIDPVNTTSSGKYYTYVTGGSWELTTLFESGKHTNRAGKDGGVDPAMYEIGSNLSLSPFVRGLAGYWTFDSGNNLTSPDASGYGLTGTWNGTSSNHYVAGKIGAYAAFFNGTNDYLAISNPIQTRQMSFSFWNLPNGSGNRTVMSLLKMITRSSDSSIIFDNLGTTSAIYSRVNAGSWEHVVVTNDVLSANKVKFYVNGVLVQTSDSSFGNAVNDSQIGGYAGTNLFSGNIDDLRVYNRILSDAEVQAIYNAAE